MNCWHCKEQLIWGGDHDIEPKKAAAFIWYRILAVQTVTPMSKFIYPMWMRSEKCYRRY